MKDKCKKCGKETEISKMVSGECYKCAFDGSRTSTIKSKENKNG